MDYQTPVVMVADNLDILRHDFSQTPRLDQYAKSRQQQIQQDINRLQRQPNDSATQRRLDSLLQENQQLSRQLRRSEWPL